eukprot:3847122-Pyramimonas_sp.AAC.1
MQPRPPPRQHSHRCAPELRESGTMCIRWLLAGDGSLRTHTCGLLCRLALSSATSLDECYPAVLGRVCNIGRLFSAALDISSPALCFVVPPCGLCR